MPFNYNLEKFYAVLKTLELEIQQDEEIKKVKGRTSQWPLLQRIRKSGKKKASEEGIPSAPNKHVCEGRAEAGKGKGKAEIEDESMHQDDFDDIDEFLPSFPEDSLN